MIGQRTGREGASRWRHVLALAAALILVLPAAAQATTVTNTADSGPGSLRAAVAGAPSGDTITFAQSLNGQTITLTSGAILIQHALTISGPGAGSLTINGNHNDSIFDVGASPTDNITISGLTLTGGAFSGQGIQGGGAIFDHLSALLTLSGVTIIGNQASLTAADESGGGGVYVDGEDLTITNSTITNNQVNITGADGSSSGGGGIYSNGGTVTITGSVVTGNRTTQTGTVSSNSDGGGGVYSDGGAVSLTNTVVNGNSSSVDASDGGSDGGGGVYSNGSPVKLSSATVNGNTFTLSNSTGSDNGGGGIYSNGGSVTLSSASVNGNTFTLSSSTGSDNGGGGVYTNGGSVNTDAASIGNNSLSVNDSSAFGDDGGGGLFSAGGAMTISSSSISGNASTINATAGNSGGGAVLDEGRASTYLNTTLSSNSLTVGGGGAQNGGGAIYAFAGGTLVDATIAGNNANAAAGAIFSRGAIHFRNTIIGGNGASPTGNCAGLGTFTSDDFNLDSGNTCGLNAAGDLVNTDPQLGPLQDNGGPTPTQGLAPSSPAVDAGSCTDAAGAPVAVDQRGVARPQPPGGKCDIGAYELAPAPVVSAISPSSGPAAGGVTVVITGSHFNGTSAVRFGNAASPSFTMVSDTEIRAVAPAGTGTVDVIVTSLGRPSATSPSDRFTYVAHPAVNTSRAAPKASAATLTGNVNPNGAPTTVFFQYGLDPTLRPPNASKALYDQSTPPQSLPGDGTFHVVSATVGNLVPNALYHVRLVATSSSGTTFGSDQTFKTLTGPPPPPPVLGKSENVDPVSGHVFVLLGGKLVPLTLKRNVPSGTTVDARRGSVELSAAGTKARKRQTGVFGGAIFKLEQAHGGLTTLALREGAFKGAPSYASCRAHKSADGHAALSSRTLQTLRSRATGHFRTRGRYAAGTVRGTRWTTTDRCDGTLIAVQQHSVLVTDLVKKITVLVRAGHHYLARPRR